MSCIAMLLVGPLRSLFMAGSDLESTNSSLIGQLDVEKDKAMDLASIKSEPIPETRHI